MSSFGDEAVIELAATVIEAQQLGHDDEVDLLSISLISTDQIGRSYGPESREMEDRLLRLNARLAVFFRRVR